MFTKEKELAILARLDAELVARGQKRFLIVCGGAALIALNIVSRATRDVDVITPAIDTILKSAAEAIAPELGLNPQWLNNGPASLAKELHSGWEKRAVTIFKGKALEISALGRSDLLATKLFAFCDREDDFEDVLRLAPTEEELAGLYEWVVARDASKEWPERVARCFVRIKRALRHG